MIATYEARGFGRLAMAGSPSCPCCKQWSTYWHDCVPVGCGGNSCLVTVGCNCCALCGGNPNKCCPDIPAWACVDKCGGSGGPCCVAERKDCCPGTSSNTCCTPAVEKCCNGHCYNEDTQGCCGGEVYNKATQGCCGGQVYDKTTKKCCYSTPVYYVTDINYECCGWRGCDPAICESCVDVGLSMNVCEVCGGDTNQKCCDGVCTPKCKIVDGPTDCWGVELGCSCASEVGECAPPSSRMVWSGFTEKICNPRGCVGDCHDDTDWCSRTYRCIKTALYTPCAICTNLVEGSIPPYYGLIYHCYGVEPAQNKCYSCSEVGGALIGETRIENDSCN